MVRPLTPPPPPQPAEVTEAVKDAWVAVHQALDRYVLTGGTTAPQQQQQQLTHALLQSVLPEPALAALHDAGLAGLVLEYVAEGLDQELVRVVGPAFWQHFGGQAAAAAAAAAGGQGGDKEGNDNDDGKGAAAAWVFAHLRAALAYASGALQERDNRLALVGQVVLGRTARQERATLRARLAAIVFNTAPPTFHGWLASFFRTSLRAWHAEWRRCHGQEEEDDDDDDGDMMSVEGGDEGDMMNVEADAWHVHQKQVEAAFQALRRLDWLPLVQSAVTGVMKGEIERYIERTCKGEYEEPRLGQVGAWKAAVLMPWLEALMVGGLEEREGSEGGGRRKQKTKRSSSFQEWRLRHDFSVYEIFAGVRMGEMFDIIRDFPDSLPAVHELRAALEITQQHRQLASSLRESMRKRLLHNGANTTQIIDVYIATIKALRVVDPTDMLLEAVARPIRSYLQARKDTVRCIVTSLTDEQGGGDLYEELRRQDALPLEQGVDSDDEDGGPGQDWMPASRDADVSSAVSGAAAGAGAPGQGPPSAAARRRGDILSMLISIYGSKDLFVSEYRLMLADKLLSNLEYNTDKEVQNLELLKLRFGEATLQPCEIMIRDVEDSKRVNINIHSRLKTQTRGTGAAKKGGPTVEEREAEATAVDITIVSHHFWPPLQEEELQLHPRMASRVEGYGESYGVLKNPRKLDFKPQLGSVQLDLEFDNAVTRAFTVAPVHATLIMHFEDQQDWAQADLARLTGLPPDVVAKRMAFWANQGVVQVSSSGGGFQYKLLTAQDPDGPSGGRGGGGASGVTNLEDDELEAAVSSDAQEAQEKDVYISYILGMLGTYGGRPVRAIHDTLKIWAGGDQKYTLKLVELEKILGRLVTEEKVEVVDGVYQLANRPAHHR